MISPHLHPWNKGSAVSDKRNRRISGNADLESIKSLDKILSSENAHFVNMDPLTIVFLSMLQLPQWTLVACFLFS